MCLRRGGVQCETGWCTSADQANNLFQEGSGSVFCIVLDILYEISSTTCKHTSLRRENNIKAWGEGSGCSAQVRQSTDGLSQFYIVSFLIALICLFTSKILSTLDCACFHYTTKPYLISWLTDVFFPFSSVNYFHAVVCNIVWEFDLYKF